MTKQWITSYTISNSTDRVVNDIYICGRTSECIGLRWNHSLYYSHVYVGVSIQKRWYIAKDGINIYGAIELLESPWTLKSWKRLTGGWEPQMAIKITESSCLDLSLSLSHEKEDINTNSSSCNSSSSSEVESLNIAATASFRLWSFLAAERRANTGRLLTYDGHSNDSSTATNTNSINNHSYSSQNAEEVADYGDLGILTFSSSTGSEMWRHTSIGSCAHILQRLRQQQQYPYNNKSSNYSSCSDGGDAHYSHLSSSSSSISLYRTAYCDWLSYLGSWDDAVSCYEAETNLIRSLLAAKPLLPTTSKEEEEYDSKQRSQAISESVERNDDTIPGVVSTSPAVESLHCLVPLIVLPSTSRSSFSLSSSSPTAAAADGATAGCDNVSGLELLLLLESDVSQCILSTIQLKLAVGYLTKELNPSAAIDAIINNNSMSGATPLLLQRARSSSGMSGICEDIVADRDHQIDGGADAAAQYSSRLLQNGLHMIATALLTGQASANITSSSSSSSSSTSSSMVTNKPNNSSTNNNSRSTNKKNGEEEEEGAAMIAAACELLQTELYFLPRMRRLNASAEQTDHDILTDALYSERSTMKGLYQQLCFFLSSSSSSSIVSSSSLSAAGGGAAGGAGGGGATAHSSSSSSNSIGDNDTNGVGEHPQLRQRNAAAAPTTSDSGARGGVSVSSVPVPAAVSSSFSSSSSSSVVVVKRLSYDHSVSLIIALLGVGAVDVAAKHAAAIAAVALTPNGMDLDSNSTPTSASSSTSSGTSSSTSSSSNSSSTSSNSSSSSVKKLFADFVKGNELGRQLQQAIATTTMILVPSSTTTGAADVGAVDHIYSMVKQSKNIEASLIIRQTLLSVLLEPLSATSVLGSTSLTALEPSSVPEDIPSVTTASSAATSVSPAVSVHSRQNKDKKKNKNNKKNSDVFPLLLSVFMQTCNPVIIYTPAATATMINVRTHSSPTTSTGGTNNEEEAATTTNNNSSSSSYQETTSVLYDGGFSEALVLRALLVDTLDRIIHTCSSRSRSRRNSTSTSSNISDNQDTNNERDNEEDEKEEKEEEKEEVADWCDSVPDPSLTIGARGLFLLAYQGVSLFTSLQTRLQGTSFAIKHKSSSYNDNYAKNDNTSFSFLRDYIVPHKYQQLIKVVKPDWPWKYTHNTNSNDSMHPTLTNERRKEKIKVGFLSKFFFRHSVGRLLAQVIINLDRTVFDVYIISQFEAESTETFDSKDTTPTDVAEALDSNTPQQHTNPNHHKNNNNKHPPSNQQEEHRHHHHHHHSQNTKGTNNNKNKPKTKNKLDNISKTVLSSVPKDRLIPALLLYDTAAAVLRIRALSLDILVFGDIFMDSNIAHLAMMRMSPVQVAFWGHPFTTGYFDTMDYFVSGVNYEPLEARYSRVDEWSEQLVLFDSLSFKFFPHEPEMIPTSVAPTLQPRIPREVIRRRVFAKGYGIFGSAYDLRSISSVRAYGSPSSSVRMYGCLQSMMKMYPIFDLAIISILDLDPQGIVILSRIPRQAVWLTQFVRRLGKTAVILHGHARGNELLQRIVLLDQAKHEEYEEYVCASDVTLDPFPFGGGVTLTDSLSCKTAVNIPTWDNDSIPTTSCNSENTTRNTSTACSGRIGASEPEEPSRVREEAISYVVPFVTAPELQSVHRLGAGIAAALNSPSFYHQPVHTNSSNSSPSLAPKSMSEMLHRLIDRYAKTAVDLAKRTSSRFKDHSDHDRRTPSTIRAKTTDTTDSITSIVKDKDNVMIPAGDEEGEAGDGGVADGGDDDAVTYAHATATTATPLRKSMMMKEEEEEQGTGRLVQDVLYDSNYAVEEWYRFLSRIAL